jgi:hypothetical protein
MKRAYFPTALVALLVLTGACTQFPALDSTITPALDAAPFPALVPLAPVLASAQPAGLAPEMTATVLDARIAALQTRAARLRGAVLSGTERQRLAQGLQ